MWVSKVVCSRGFNSCSSERKSRCPNISCRMPIWLSQLPSVEICCVRNHILDSVLLFTVSKLTREFTSPVGKCTGKKKKLKENQDCSTASLYSFYKTLQSCLALPQNPILFIADISTPNSKKYTIIFREFVVLARRRTIAHRKKTLSNNQIFTAASVYSSSGMAS